MKYIIKLVFLHILLAMPASALNLNEVVLEGWRADCYMIPRSTFMMPLAYTEVEKGAKISVGLSNLLLIRSKLGQATLRVIEKNSQVGNPAPQKGDYCYAIIISDIHNKRLYSIYLDRFKPEGVVNDNIAIIEKDDYTIITNTLEDIFSIFTDKYKRSDILHD